ncbi:hypothetical protein [Paenibacillus agilis]|uniref:Uncharacterized protein n=1 Tax=Paenibacillus agilis TaxID=3020863 RepID=A0A559ID53_9BACL|nr:hypothetical protein [Paenibacillus agilis]TVX85556.1 hypothetical protein FPZ44_24685 [Paenibacillus agilis]
MYGNVYAIYDHLRMIWYRQDMNVNPAGDLFDGYLPFYCDYCDTVVPRITRIAYQLTFEMIVRPRIDPSWVKNQVHIKFACCESCRYGPLALPQQLIGYHLTELRQDGNLIYTQERKE